MERRKNGRRKAAILTLALASAFAQGDPAHFTGMANYYGYVRWEDPRCWLENVVPSNKDVVFYALPYDTTSVDLGYSNAEANNLYMLRGNWKLGDLANMNFEVGQNFYVGDVSNPENFSHESNAYFTLDMSGSTIGAPDFGDDGYMKVYGDTYVGYSAGSNGHMTLIGSGLNPLLNTRNFNVGYYGTADLTLNGSSIGYNSLNIGLMDGSSGSLTVNGAPYVVYTANYYFQDGALDTLYNANLNSFSLQSNDADWSHPYNVGSTLVSQYGQAKLLMKDGATARFGTLWVGENWGGAGSGDLEMTANSFGWARHITVRDGGVINVSGSYLADRFSIYSGYNVGNEGGTQIYGPTSGAAINLNQSTFEAQNEIEILGGGSLNLANDSHLFFSSAHLPSWTHQQDVSIYVEARDGLASSLNVDHSTVDLSTGLLGVGWSQYSYDSTKGDPEVNIRNGGSLTAAALDARAGVVNVSGAGSSLHVTGQADIGQQFGTDPTWLNVVDGATAQFDTYLKAGDAGTISVVQAGHADGSITVGQVSTPTQQGHIQVGVGGIFGGDGTYNGAVDVTGGILDPGYCPGVTTINGNLTVTSGYIVIDLGGPDPGTGYDQINVNGAFSMTGGTVEFLGYNGWIPSGGEVFDIFNANSIMFGPNVTFIDLTGWSNGTPFSFHFDPHTGRGVAAATPEPASFAAVAMGLLGCLRRRKKRA
jgi:T5SS/PEP-CTERM-associated repeat protein